MNESDGSLWYMMPSESSYNPLPDDKMLALSKLKAFGDDNFYAHASIDRGVYNFHPVCLSVCQQKTLTPAITFVW